MKTTDDIRYVGGIQDYGEPFLALYVDVSSGQLYLMIRLDPLSDNLEYAMTTVCVSEVEDYMKYGKSLSEVLKGKEFWLAVFEHGHLNISIRHIPNLKEAIEDVDGYCSEDCEDEFKIFTLLNRIKNNMPLGMVTVQRAMIPVGFISANNTANVHL